jgi:hypothetical protein
MWAVVMGQQADLRGAGTVPEILRADDIQARNPTKETDQESTSQLSSEIVKNQVDGAEKAKESDEDDGSSDDTGSDDEDDDDDDEINDDTEFPQPSGARKKEKEEDTHKARMPDFSHLDKKVSGHHYAVVVISIVLFFTIYNYYVSNSKCPG